MDGMFFVYDWVPTVGLQDEKTSKCVCLSKPLEEPAQHGGLAVPILARDRGDDARRVLLIEADAEKAVRANERANLRAVGEAPAEDPPSQGPNRDIHQIPGILLRNIN